MASTATKTNEFSGSACQEKDSNRCILNDADLSSPQVNSACNDKHHTSSDTSHPLSACLSRESFSENAESEETLGDCNTSKGNKMIVKPTLCQTFSNKCGPLQAPIFHDKIVKNQLERPKESDCLGDNISFICGSDYMKARTSGKNSNADKKNTSYSAASVDRFPEAEKLVNHPPASCCLVGSTCGEVDDNHLRRLNTSSNDSSQEILCCSNKSDYSEISSLRESCAAGSSRKGGRSECSEEQVQSSVARADALQVGSQIGDEHNTAESVKVDTGMNEREQMAEVKASQVVKEVNMQDTTMGTWPAACGDGSDSIEYEVKVCDICGDIGREELLAICSKCNDGAEHIYCMRVKMDKVPKGDWMCEECVLSEEAEKQKHDKVERRIREFKKSHVLESETRSLTVDKTKAPKISSTPVFSSKRPTGSLQAVGKRPVGTVLQSPEHQSGGHSPSTMVKNARIPNESSCESPKFLLQSQGSRGYLFKSKSFSTMSLKKDVQMLKEGGFCNERFSKETAASDSKGRVKMLTKSLSLKNMRSTSVNNSNPAIKLLPNHSSRDEDLKRSRHLKGQQLNNTEKKPRLAKSNSCASEADKRITSPKKISLPHLSSSSCNDLMALKDHHILDDVLNISCRSGQGGSPNQERKKIVNEKRQVEHATEVVPATSTKHTNAKVHSDELHGSRDSSVFASEVHKPWISVVPELDDIWQGKFEIQRTGGLPFTCDGMHAHLPTYASRKVLEVVQKLPSKLLLDEAPRLRPPRFMKSHATEDDIALYFFAEDLDSYEKCYKNLLDWMIENDVSLKGNFAGLELLIFSSNLLPEKSQRWNNLLFLWGVFRGQKVQCTGQIPALSASENFLPPGKSSQNISASLESCNTQETLISNTLLDSKAVTSGRMFAIGEIKASSRDQKTLDPQIGSFKREASEPKGRPDIDLNCCLQESEENYTDRVVDGTRDCKRLKSCFTGINIGNNSIKESKKRCSIDINTEGPRISGELKCNRSHDMSVVSSQLDSVGNKYESKSLEQQSPKNDSWNRRDFSVSNVELKLGVGRSTDQGNKPPFFMLMGRKDDENSQGEKGNDTKPSLALSLALPYPKTGDAILELESERKLPKFREVNTTLSLFGVSLQS